MTMEEKDRFLKANPDVRQLITKVNLVRGVGGIKTDEGFKELMSKIGEAHPTSEVAKQYGKKDGKSVKIRETVDARRKKAGI